MTQQEIEQTVSKSSKVTVGLLVASAGMAIPVMIACTAFLWSLKLDVHDMKGDIVSLKESVYSVQDAREDALREAMENPDHIVPIPKDPLNYHND